ncbi:MAG: T9SS type A sorting domain-containing protein [Bacteroidales bacterium]
MTLYRPHSNVLSDNSDNIYSTSYGGCLLAGAAYDWRIQYYDRDAILLKVDENGFITSIHQLEYLHTHDAIVYPYPGKEKLVIEIGLQIGGARFVLYNMVGKPSMETMLNHTSKSLNTSQLSADLYLWNIIYKGKVIESGRWVKE